MLLSADVALKIKQNQQEYCENFNKIRDIALPYVTTPTITTSTILLCCRNRFDLKALQGKVNTKKKSGRFSNQLTVQVGNASVKIFENGKLHVTGTRSLPEACSKAVTIFDQELVLTDFKFQMLNVKFRLDMRIILSDFIRSAKRRLNTVFYDPSRYPGVRVKIPNHGTALIFATGSVLLTGAASPTSIFHMISFVESCLTFNPTPCSILDSYWVDNMKGMVVN